MNWGVFNERNILVSKREGVSEEEAKEMANRWNETTNTNWYTARLLKEDK